MQVEILKINDELRLRPLLASDYDLALEWYSNEQILWYSENRKEPYDIEMIDKMYTYLSDVGELYVIEVYENDWQPIGDVTLSEKTLPMVIAPAYQGKGIGSLVIHYLLERAQSLGYGKISLSGIYTYNQRSYETYVKCGFKEIQRDKEKIYMEIEL